MTYVKKVKLKGILEQENTNKPDIAIMLNLK